MRYSRLAPAAALAAALAALCGCTVAGAASATGSSGRSGLVPVVIGYQSKTIDTVTAGTLLRSLGYFRRELDALSSRTGRKYAITWEDYSTGAPITAQMLAGKIDIGSMGDYPLLINGSRSQALGGSSRTEMIAVTAYNMRSALNGIVVPAGSGARTLRDLAGKAVSTSVGSAGDGLLVQALRQQGMNPASSVTVENQQPQIGASALAAGDVAALAQFADWPGLLVYQGKDRLLYDGGQLRVPTLHGVVTRDSFAAQHPDIVRAFLRAEVQATGFLHAHPLRAAQIVSRATGVPAPVVYLYNGPDGLATFDPTIKPALRAAMSRDLPYLTAMGVLQARPLRLTSFINDSYLRQVLGGGYDRTLATTTNPAAITGTDAACHRQVTSPATAGELWLAGQDSTQPAATPSCLLRAARAAQRAGHRVLAAYVPDAVTGTRWFASRCQWAQDPAAPSYRRFLPFTTEAGAESYVAAHSGTRLISYAAAVAAS